MLDQPTDTAPAVRLLSLPCLTLGSGATHALERKDAALLAILTTEGACSPAAAASLLWPDTPDGQARTNLRQRLFRLRKLAGRYLLGARGKLQLAPGLAVDILQFPQALARDPAAGAGELLGNLDYSDTGALEHWVLAARQRWRSERAECLATHSSELEVRQEIAAALALAQRIVADDPLHEHAHRRLMRLHYLRGDRSAALAAFQHCRATLRDQQGAQPSRETAHLAALIEASGTLLAAAKPPRAIAILRPPRLVGREEPWSRLERARHGAAMVLLEGEAGIGKTRLLGDFAAAHGDAPMFGARPGDAGLPYALLARIVRGLSARYPAPAADWVLPELARVAPELGVPAAGQLSGLRLQQALVEALNGWRQLGGLDLFVIDDLHHADTATLELLPALTAGAHALGIACLLGVRPGELPAAIAPWVDAQDAQTLERIALGPLDLAGVGALLASLALPDLDAALWAPALARHAGGNPLFLLETLIAMLGADGPGAQSLAGEPPVLPASERIGRLIERRLTQLSAPALKLARVAAIAGQDFSAALAAQVLGLHALDIADTWRELEAALVIRDDAFAHDLIFEGTLRSVPQAIARQVHHDVALALQAANAPPARLAAHWFAAQDWAAAGDAFADAARAAFAAARRVEEAGLWDQAVLCFQQAGLTDKVFQARLDSVEACLAARPIEAVLLLTEALCATAGSDAQRLAALLAHGRALKTAERHDAAVRVADDALALAQALGDTRLLFNAACLSALCLSPGPRAGEGIERLATFRPLVEAEGEPRQRLCFYGDLSVAMHCAERRSEAAALYVLGIDAARAAGDSSEELILASNLSGLLGQLGRFQAGREQADRACRLLERVGSPDGTAAAMALVNLALFDLHLGRMGEALQGLEQAYRRLGAEGGTAMHAVCETHLAMYWLQLGQPARAMQALRPLCAAVKEQLPGRQGRRLTIEARIDRALRRPALPRLDEALQWFGPAGNLPTRLPAELDRSRELEPADALAVCERVRQVAEPSELLALGMRARVFAIDAHRRAGNVEQAAREARAAAREWHDCRPADLYWPEALWIACQALRDADDGAGMQALLDEAAHWIHHIAGPHVPAPFRDGFLHRNPVNRAILTAATRCSAQA